MFFKKRKVLGTVTIFEEDDLAAEDKFNDLGIDAEKADQLDIMTTTQLKELALANARAGKEATARTVQLANEANQIGLETAEKLHDQTENLEKLGDDFVVVHEYLNKTERKSPFLSFLSIFFNFLYTSKTTLTWKYCLLFSNFNCQGVVNKMRTPRILRMFQRRKGRKGLDSSPLSKKELKKQEEMRRNGVESLAMERNESTLVSIREATVVTMDDVLESSSGGGRKGKQYNKTKNRHVSAPVGMYDDLQEESDVYGNYDDDVADVLRDQDNDLDDLSQTLMGMKDVAVAMNHELDHQRHLINQMQDYTEQTKIKTAKNTKAIKEIE